MEIFMKNCPSCNNELKDNSTTCSYCGEVIVKKERGNVTFPMNPLSKPLSVGAYMLMMLIGMISPLNVILYLIWAFSPNTNINRKNYARAMLLMWLIVVILGVGAYFLLTKVFSIDLTNIKF